MLLKPQDLHFLAASTVLCNAVGQKEGRNKAAKLMRVKEKLGLK